MYLNRYFYKERRKKEQDSFKSWTTQPIDPAPDLALDSRLAESETKTMCWKAGDPWAFLNCQDSLLPFTRRKPTANGQHTVLIRVFTLSTTEVKQSVYFNPTDTV